MSVYEALQVIIKTVDDSVCCGKVAEEVEKAKLILYKYVTEKLVEEKSLL